IALGARRDEALRAGFLDRPDVVRHELPLREFLIAHPREWRPRTPFVRPEDLVRPPRGVQDLHHRAGDLLPPVTRDAADPVQDLRIVGLHGLRGNPRRPLLGRLAEQVVRLPDVREVRLELLPAVAGGPHPLLPVVPQRVERDVDGTDVLAGTAARALPRVPSEVLARFPIPAKEPIKGAAHLVLAQSENPAAG